MEIENRGMSKRREKFHMRISGSYEESVRLYEEINKLPNFLAASIQIKVAKEQVTGSIVCTSSNPKRFGQQLEKLIKEFNK